MSGLLIAAMSSANGVADLSAICEFRLAQILLSQRMSAKRVATAASRRVADVGYGPY
ncbi:hypothetical protein [Ruegeria arenilitoris]|uniref:hypothetical protein n=1 Tax=Ruegeria arenilitoris TaxID=1173585 RepID=UPI001C2CBE57|nr:hypothetical protein [Ruegeria arenilitoris]